MRSTTGITKEIIKELVSKENPIIFDLGCRIANFSKETLIKYIEGTQKGYHLAQGMLQTKEEYYQQFKLYGRIYVPNVLPSGPSFLA